MSTIKRLKLLFAGLCFPLAALPSTSSASSAFAQSFRFAEGLQIPDQRILRVQFHPQNPRLLALLTARQLGIWDLDKGDWLWLYEPLYRNQAYRLFFFSDSGARLAIDDGLGRVWMLDARSGALEHEIDQAFEHRDDRLVGAAFIDGESRLLFVSDRRMRWMEYSLKDRTLHLLADRQDLGDCVAFFQIGKEFGCASQYGFAALTRAENARPVPIRAVPFESELRMLPLADLSVIEDQSGEAAVVYPAYDEPGLIAAGLKDGRKRGAFAPQLGFFPYLFSEALDGGRRLLTAGGDTFKIWDVRNHSVLQQGRIVTSEAFEEFITAIDASPDGRYLAFVLNDRKLQIFNAGSFSAGSVDAR